MKANEPVAWMDYLEHSDVYDLNVSGRGIPLYTHPVKEQDESFDRTASHMAGEYVSYKAELTDEEIMDESFKAGLAISKDTDVFLLEHDAEALVTFARAILRKAQE